MSWLGITQWPVEIWAEVTSFLTDADIVLRLFGCGNLLLNRRFIEGGVTHLTLTLPKLTPRIVSIIQSLRLRSFNHASSPLSPPEIAALARGLQPTLLDLTLNHVYSLLKTFELESNPAVTVTCSAYRIWRVRDSFPVLRTLHLESDEDLVHPDLAIQFLLGLPQSLTDLRLPMNPVPIDVWRLLPPNLTSLKGVTGAIPTLKTAARFDSLTSLELYESGHLIGKQSRDLTSLPSGELPQDEDRGAVEKWVAITDPSLLCLPPHLTSLESHIKFLPHYVLPKTLTSVVWRNWRVGMNLLDLFEILPASITSLEVDSCSLDMRSGTSSKLALLPQLVRLTLMGNPGLTSNISEADFYERVFNSVPRLEHLQLQLRSNRPLDGLSPENLGRLNSSLLSIHADFDKRCFEPSEGGDAVVYPLHAFTKLEKLTLGRKVCGNFTFASLPSSLTSFRSSTDLSSETLHLIPPSVTKLSTSLLMDGKNVQLLSGGWLASSPRASTSSSTKAESMHPCSSALRRDEGPVETFNFKPRMPVRFHRSAGTDRVLFEPNLAADNHTGPKLAFPSSYPPLPSTLTSLTFSARVPHELLTPSALPLLSYLSLGHFDSELNLGAFTSLQTLQFVAFPDEYSFACPPNLTRLSGIMLELPASFLPLPSSLAEIESQCLFTPYDALRPLTNLRTLRIGANASDLLEIATESLTSLDLRDCTLEEAESLTRRLPSLQVLDCLCEDREYTLFDLLYQCLPHAAFERVALKFTEGNFVQLLAERACAIPGEVAVPASGRLHTWFDRMLFRAYPRAKARSTDTPTRFNIESWASFIYFTGPNTTIINSLIADTTLPPNFTEHLPMKLTTLIITRASPNDEEKMPELSNLSMLPRTLTILEHTLATIDAANLQDLPQSLTRLIIGGVSNLPSPASTLPWPANLVDLEIGPCEELPSALIMTLPPTLVALRMHLRETSLSDLELLPSSLKYLRADTYASHDFVQFCRERGIARVTSSRQWLQNSKECNYLEMLSALLNKYDLKHLK